jgi:hypothetical protein
MDEGMRSTGVAVVPEDFFWLADSVTGASFTGAGAEWAVE